MGSLSLDYLDVESLLSLEERLVRDNAREFVEQEYLPLVLQAFREAYFPKEILPRLAARGFLGSNLPEKYGCAGLNSVASGLLYQELERGDSGLRTFVTVQSALVMFPIFAFGSEEQRERWLPRLAKGEAIGCFGLTEPDYGSDPGGMVTRARRAGAEYVITGRKRWISNGSIADLAIVWAKTEGDDPKSIRGFLVERGTPGFSAPQIHGKVSLRTSVSSELVLEECRVPAQNLLPGTQGLKSALQCTTEARYGISWGAIGAALACYECALEYARNRKVFSRPIAGYQLVQQKLVTMATEITKAQLLALRLGRLKDEGKLRPQQASLAKMNNVSEALRIARLARDILGGNGILDEYPVIRHLLNLEAVNTYEGTEDIHRLAIGRDLTGLSAFDA